jgi:hypothetical protein
MGAAKVQRTTKRKKKKAEARKEMAVSRAFISTNVLEKFP